VWKTGFFLGLLLALCFALLSWLAGLAIRESRPASPASKPQPPKLRLAQRPRFRLILDGISGPLPVGSDAGGYQHTSDGAVVLALEIRVEVVTDKPLKDVRVWIEPSFSGQAPLRTPDLAASGISMGFDPVIVGRRLDPPTADYWVVVQNMGGAISSGSVEVTEQIIEVY
jgi:hypothetical protein